MAQKKLNDQITVCGAMTAEDFAQAKAQGFQDDYQQSGAYRQ